jgi:peroxiredoxin
MPLLPLGLLSLATAGRPAPVAAQSGPAISLTGELPAPSWSRPDPRALLDAMAEALRKVHSISYDADYRGEGALASRIRASTGRVVMERAGASSPMSVRFRAEGSSVRPSVGKETSFLAVCDGRYIRKIQGADGVVREADLEVQGLGATGSFLAGGVDGLLLWEAFRDDSFALERAADHLRYEGEEEVAGVRSHKVYAQYTSDINGLTKRVRLFIGVSDHLPRRIERIVLDDGSLGSDGAYVMTLRDVRAGGAVGASTFQLALSEGTPIQQVIAEELDSAASLLSPGTPAPGWTLQGPDGESSSLSDFRGRIVVMDFWATSCVPCKLVMPDLQELHEDYDLQDVVVVGVSVNDDGNPAGFMNQQGYTYRLLLNGEVISEQYGILAIPTIYIIDQEGRVAYSQVGIPDGGGQKIREVIDALLGRPAPSASSRRLPIGIP